MLEALLRKERTVVSACNENTRTAMVFGRLAYLPSDLCWQVIRSIALPSSAVPDVAGEIEDVQFWPSWSLDGKASLRFGKRNPKPDAFFRFSEIDLIIEAKKSDDDLQYADQLAVEYLSWRRLDASERGTKCAVVAAGGFRILTEVRAIRFQKEVQDAVAALEPGCCDFSLAAFSWSDLLAALLKLQDTMSLSREHRAIIGDLIAALQIHGTAPPFWLRDLPQEAAKAGNITIASIAAFRERQLAPVPQAWPTEFKELSPIAESSISAFLRRSGRSDG